jgi:hypothetical protein
MTLTSLPALRCLRASHALQSYLDGEADELTARQVSTHLEDCRRCGMQAGESATPPAGCRMSGRSPTSIVRSPRVSALTGEPP